MGIIRQMFGLEAQDIVKGGELVVAICPNEHELTEQEIMDDKIGFCPFCDADLVEDSHVKKSWTKKDEKDPDVEDTFSEGEEDA